MNLLQYVLSNCWFWGHDGLWDRNTCICRNCGKVLWSNSARGKEGEV